MQNLSFGLELFGSSSGPPCTTPLVLIRGEKMRCRLFNSLALLAELQHLESKHVNISISAAANLGLWSALVNHIIPSGG